MSTKQNRSTPLQNKRGWELIRGRTSNWANHPELLEIERLSDRVDDFGDAWFDFHRARSVGQANDDKPASDWFLTMRVLESRQVGLLDAIRATSMIGRPAATGVLLRAMYEALLNVLIIGFDTGPIDKKLLYRATENPTPTKEELASRFQAFGAYSLRVTLKKTGVLDRLSEDEKLSISRALLAAESAEATFGFDADGRNCWHPFKGSWHLYRHLWPRGEDPKFPSELIAMDEVTWKRFFFTCYEETSHDVHASGHSTLKNELSRYYGNDLRLAQRDWHSTSLLLGLLLAKVTINVIAYTMGDWEVWMEAANKYGVLKGDDGDEGAEDEKVSP